MAEIEEWKEIKESLCSVSNFGRVRNNKTGHIYTPFLNTTKYEQVEIRYVDKSIKRKLVNRLVAEYFLENPENKPFVDHVDNNPLNNRASNLRYATRQENSLNRNLQSNNTSGYTGVYFSNERWIAVIKRNGKTEHLGTFSTKEEAIAKRKEAEAKYFSLFRK